MLIDEERLAFVRYWAKYVKTHDPKDWSTQQKKLIDSVLLSANQDREIYIKIKKMTRLLAKTKK